MIVKRGWNVTIDLFVCFCIDNLSMGDLSQPSGTNTHDDHGIFLIEITLKRELAGFLLAIYLLPTIKSPLHFDDTGKNSSR